MYANIYINILLPILLYTKAHTTLVSLQQVEPALGSLGAPPGGKLRY